MSNWLPKMLLQGIEFAAVQQQPCRQFFSRLSCIPKRDLPSFPFSLYCRRSHLGLHVGGLRPGVVTLKTMQPLSLLVRIRAFLAGEVANCWSIGRSSSTRDTCWSHVEWRWFWHVLACFDNMQLRHATWVTSWVTTASTDMIILEIELASSSHILECRLES